MPIILNGTGTISGLTAGGLPSSSVTTANIADNAVTYAKIGTTEQGQLCKAWVNFNGTSTVAIRASYNVSSITDVGVGEYRVNLTTSMSDANYSAVLSMQPTVTNNGSDTFVDNVSTASFVSLIHYEDGTRRDSNLVSLAIFR